MAGRPGRTRTQLTVPGAQWRCPSKQGHRDERATVRLFGGEIFQRYFRPAIGAYPRMGGALVERLFALTDDVPDRLAQTRGAAMAWGKAETPNARITSELFVVTQHGLMYAAGLNESRRALYYLATPSRCSIRSSMRSRPPNCVRAR